jgi:hypothetical protein
MGIIKKIILILLVVLMSSLAISCEGCSNNNPTAPEKTSE